MATSSNRDVKLTVEAGVTGEQAIKSLAAQVRSLGKEGTDAAPEFERLGVELDGLASQARTITTLKALEAEIGALAATQRNASVAAEKAGAAYQEQVAQADKLRAALRESQQAYRDAQRAEVDAKRTRDALRESLADLTKAERLQNAEYKAASAAVIETTAARKLQLLALQEEKARVGEVVAVERTLGVEYRKTSAALSEADSALRKRNMVLTESQDAANKAGVNTRELVAEEARLAATLTNVAATAETNRTRLNELADATKKAADASVAAQRAETALLGIREAAFKINQAAKLGAEAKAQADLTAKTDLAYRAQLALKNIRDAAAQQNQVAKDEAEAASKAQLAEKTNFAARALQALDNIRKAAFQQNQASKIQAEADAMARLSAEAERVARILPDAFGAVGVRSIQAIQIEINQTATALRTLEASAAAGTISQQDLARATGAAEQRMQALRGELRQMPAAAGVFERMNASVLDMVNRFGALSAAVATVGFAVRPLIDVTAQLDSMRRVLTQVYGSLEEANKQIANVEQVANNAGVNVLDTSKAFVKFASAAKAAGIETEVVNTVFNNTVKAAGNLGLSGDEVSRILTALSQTASKGRVSMEELSQQLGDSLPGALNLMAKGLGITLPDLIKLVETGGLLADQALPALGQALVELGGTGEKVEGLAQSFARLQNAVTETLRGFSNTTGYKVLSATVDGLATNFDKVTTAATVALELFGVRKITSYVANLTSLSTATSRLTGASSEATSVATANAAANEATAAAQAARSVATERTTVLTVANTTATVANTVAAEANALATTARTVAAERGVVAVGASAAALAADTAATVANTASKSGLAAGVATVAAGAAGAAASVGLLGRAAGLAGSAFSGLLRLLGGLPGLLLLTALNAKDLGKFLGETAAEMFGLSDETRKARQALKDHADEAERAAKVQQQVGQSWVEASVAYANALGPIQANIGASEKLSKAKELEGKARERIAALAGDEVGKLQAATVATQEQVSASEKVYAARQAEVTSTQALVDQYESIAEAKGKLSDAEKKQLDATKQNLEAVKAAAEQAKQKLDGDKAAADQALLTAEAYGDTSGALDTLAKAYDDARSTVEQMRIQMERGLVTQAQVTQATLAAALAQNRYRAAMEDSTAKTKFAADTRTALTKIDVEGVRTTQELSKAREKEATIMAASAQTRGDSIEVARQESKVLAEQIIQREADITIAKKEIETTRLNVEAAIVRIREQRNELEARKQLSPEMARQLDLQLLEQRAALRGIDTSKAKVRAIEAETKALKDRAAQQRLAASASYDLGANAGLATLGGSQATRNASVQSTIKSDFSIDQKSGTIGSIYTPPPDNSGEWEWVSDNATPGGRWQLSAAGRARRKQAEQQQLAVVQQAYAAAGLALPSGGVPSLGLPAAVRAQLQGTLGNYSLAQPATPTVTPSAVADVPTATGSSASGTARVFTFNVGGASATFTVGSDAQAAALDSLLNILGRDLARAA